MNPLSALHRYGLLVATLLGLSGLATAHGQSTIVSTLTFELLGGDLPVSLAFTPFDTSLGTLQSVSFSFNGTQRFDFSFWNKNVGSTNPIKYGYQPNYTDLSVPSSPFGGSTLTLNGSSLSIADSAKLSGTATLTGLAAAPINAARAAASTAFFAGSDPTAGVLSSGGYSVYGTLPFSGALALSNAFNGSLSAQFEPFSFASVTSGNVATNENQEYVGSATVTYTYAAIPEPATYAALLGVAVFGLALKRRRTVWKF